MNKQISVLMLLGSGLLLIVPIVVLILGWQWQPSAHPLGGESTLWIANSAAKPWGALTILLCLVLLFFILKLPKKAFIQLAIIMVATLMLGQLIKVVVKNGVKEPRPYVVWVSNQLSISPEHFYQVSRPEREQLLHNGLSHSSLIPQWQLSHWRAETGYAFPSGHSLFSTTLALFVFVLCMLRRHYFLASLGILWGIDVTVGRIILGMHWASDVIVGILISAVLVWCAFWMIERRLLLKP
ncbi:phosphatidylglycerophosphatase B [Proteus mirabilis]|uniref:phosphatidylglycerophosphatase B n=1 Tax=Proteus mirabilis TaxID=584 RepID=UPI0021BAD627|nr:phosphatidylglycerophosphatase B [Proteus mirabilis]MCT8223256.1 phosphatidylglycerophosphatase B [Proteus mirabilis]MDF7222199.1 phosphatidylglycerophosphatase B [Proteus mirabilis]MDF7261312.1 phosphatidylglycerophosphatase B [Proteus mirabilis]MDF7308751.1 phosphatidylglycerophosphatase B [Proteus mirabilis]MDF7362467.1 phosphatidylglycerophosphatase B [Proteus mirabilis]